MFRIVAVMLSIAIALGINHRCGQPSIGPVLAGVDLVDFRNRNSGSSSLNLAQKGLSLNRAFYGGNYEFWFLTDENRAEFSKNPTKYVPQFGGYSCQ